MDTYGRNLGSIWAPFGLLARFLLVARGTSIPDVSRRLGHRDPSFTLSRYLHPQDSEVGLLDALEMAFPSEIGLQGRPIPALVSPSNGIRRAKPAE
jgi:hypothetical protein